MSDDSESEGEELVRVQRRHATRRKRRRLQDAVAEPTGDPFTLVATDDSATSEGAAARRKKKKKKVGLRRVDDDVDSDPGSANDDDPAGPVAPNEEEDGKTSGGNAVVVKFETLDMRRTRELLANPHLDARFRQLLFAMYKEVNRQGGFLVGYKHAVGCKSGRLYAQTGMQLCPAAGRRLCQPDDVIEFDIQNSVPAIFLAVSRSSGVTEHICAALAAYVEHRDESLAAVASLLGTDRAGAKSAYLRLTHGAKSVHDSEGRSIRPSRTVLPELWSYAQSVSACVAELKQSYPKLYGWCDKRGDDTKTPCGQRLYTVEGRFVHYLTTHAERQVMEKAELFFRAHGCEVITLIHDAVLVQDKKGVLRAPAVLEELSEFISQQKLVRPDTMRARGKTERRRFPAPRLTWRMDAMVEREGDLEAMLDKSSKGTPAEQTGFANTYVYTTEDQLFLYTAPDGSERRGLHDVGFGDGVRVNLINAGMGMGKTHLANKKIVECLLEDPTRRILWITGRSTQALSACKPLVEALRENGLTAEVVCYNKSQAYCLADAQVLVVQYESLHRLRQEDRKTASAKLTRYDFLVVDEFRLISDQRVSTVTNKLRLRENNRIFEEVCARTARVLVLDADLTTSPVCRDFWLGLREGGAGATIATQAECKMHDYRVIPQRLRRDLEVVPPEKQFMSILTDNLREGRLTMVPFRSNRALYCVYDALDPVGAPARPNRHKEREDCIDQELQTSGDLPSGWNRGARVRLLTAETSTQDVASIMTDLDAFLQEEKCVVFLYTSALCVAANVTLPVHCVMLHCGSDQMFAKGGPVARILWQMVMRARSVENQAVQVYLGDQTLAPDRVRKIGGKRLERARHGWQHDDVYEYLRVNYATKRAQVMGRPTKGSDPSVYSVIGPGEAGWGEVTDEATGRKYSVEIQSSLLSCLLARKAEIEHNRGRSLWDRLMGTHALVVEEPKAPEELEALRDKLLATEAGPSVVTVAPKQEKAATDSVKLQTKQALRRLPWVEGIMCQEWARDRQAQHERKGRRERPGTVDKLEKDSVLPVLSSFPGLLVKYAGADLPDDDQLYADYDRARKASNGLRNLFLIRTDREDVAEIDHNTVHGPRRNTLPVTARFVGALRIELDRIAAKLGFADMKELLTSDDTTISSAQARAIQGDLVQAVTRIRRAQSDVGVNPPRADKVAANNLKWLLRQVGHELRSVDRVREMDHATGLRGHSEIYVVRMISVVKELQSAHEHFLGEEERAAVLAAHTKYTDQVEKEAADRQKRRESEGDQRAEKRRKIASGEGVFVTADAAVG